MFQIGLKTEIAGRYTVELVVEGPREGTAGPGADADRLALPPERITKIARMPSRKAQREPAPSVFAYTSTGSAAATQQMGTAASLGCVLDELVAYLDGLEELRAVNPSTEEVARAAAAHLAARCRRDGMGALTVRVWEDPSAWASHRIEL